ncbi:MAG: PDZ domain-containing protein [Planctomycetes bacterium]|nr:PDZ domain-containing protein [Planctomycetota bacterium]
MHRQRSLYILAALVFMPVCRLSAQDINDKVELAMKQAVAKAAPSVVQIVTQGGADMVVTGPKGPAFRKALGPTTGVIVGADGYVVSSAFNFINNPTVILVAVPGKAEPLVAKRVATDRARMVTLLKVEATGLPVPAFVPRKELRVGQWAIALGRTLDAKRASPPSVSVGIISALDRIWGRALQTDAKISPVNYGGPVIDIQGRVQGILVPASPRGDGETAGFEWYDSGIGFAIPMEDVFAVLPRLKQGKDLMKGLLGVRLASQDIYGAAPIVSDVVKDSAAAAAGIKAGDLIVEIDGKPVVRMAQILHILGPKYEGDKITLKFKRGNEVIAVNDLELVSSLKQFAHSYLGILPMRDDPKLGVEVRFVFPKSPAEKAGLKAGDRIVKIGQGKTMRPFSGTKSGRDELFDFLNVQSPGTELQLEVVRQDAKDKKTDMLKVTLDRLPGIAKAGQEEIPTKLPEPASHKKALAPLETTNPNIKPPKIDPGKDKPATGFIKRLATAGGKYWIYVPEDYDPNIAHALVVFLHPPGKHGDDDTERFADAWADYCSDNRIILLQPTSDKESGWGPGDMEYVLETVRDVTSRYTIDRQRIVAHGLGVGGQMALYLGFHARDLFRGVATIGAVATQMKDNVAGQRLSFYIAGGDRDPLIKSIAEGRDKLVQRNFPTFYREIPNRGREYFEEAILREMIRWIDCLDRQ